MFWCTKFGEILKKDWANHVSAWQLDTFMFIAVQCKYSSHLLYFPFLIFIFCMILWTGLVDCRFYTTLFFLSPGEIVVNEVNFVRKCISAESSQDDLWGKLICTNFKVSFIPQDTPPKQVFVQTKVLKQLNCYFEMFAVVICQKI